MSILFSLPLTTISPTSAAQASTTTCAQAQWTTEPEINEQGNFQGSLAAECELKLDKKGSLLSVHKAFISNTQAAEIHSGPTLEVYLGLPSVFYDATFHTVERGDSVTVRKDIHIATDAKTRVIESSFSTENSGSGQAAYLRRVDLEKTVTLVSELLFKFKLVQTVEVAKPWYAPLKIFFKEAKKNIFSNFGENIEKLAESITQSAESLEE